MLMYIEYWYWFLLGMLLIIAEVVLPTAVALWFGLAALCVGILLWFFPDMPLAMQALIWIILSIGCTIFWFKYIKPLSKDKTRAGLSRENTIGQIGLVVQTHLEHDHILVRFTLPVLGSDEWRCRSTLPVSVGERVIVIDILGNDFIVKPLTQNNNIIEEK